MIGRGNRKSSTCAKKENVIRNEASAPRENKNKAKREAYQEDASSSDRKFFATIRHKKGGPPRARSHPVSEDERKKEKRLS